MRKTICDYCGAEIKRPSDDFTGDLDRKNLAVVRVKPLLLNQSDSTIDNPDLCVGCIIEVLKDKAI